MSSRARIYFEQDELDKICNLLEDGELKDRLVKESKHLRLKNSAQRGFSAYEVSKDDMDVFKNVLIDESVVFDETDSQYTRNHNHTEEEANEYGDEFINKLKQSRWNERKSYQYYILFKKGKTIEELIDMFGTDRRDIEREIRYVPRSVSGKFDNWLTTRKINGRKDLFKIR